MKLAFGPEINNAELGMSKHVYVTTAIDYVNGQPHLGHAYEKVITDVIARGKRSLGHPTFFLTGVDEHGQKIQQSAGAAGLDSQSYCDRLEKNWRDFCDRLQLSHNDFVRTSEHRHEAIVKAILNKLYAKGHFYFSEYHGFYSTRQETFLAERDRNPDGSFDPMYGEVMELTEENYYFRLREHQDWLIDYIEAHPEFIRPENRRNEVLGLLKNNTLEDLCISRPISRLTWGIPLPFDTNFITYVWFDALVNYISIPAAYGDPVIIEALEGAEPTPPAANPDFETWPADVHVIGKDILKFHAVYWPIMLKALDLPQPKQILVHGWWQKEGQKLSKSTGNIVDPIEVIDDWGLDAFRYYLVRELDIGPDGNWTDDSFAGHYHADLANGLGNLMNRSLSMLKRYRKGVVPDRSDELKEEAETVIAKTRALLEAYEIQQAVFIVWSFITRVNQYIDQTAPYKLAKDPEQAQRLDEILYNLVESCRLLAILIWPFIPNSATRMLEQLALEQKPDTLAQLQWGDLEPGHEVGQASPLFPRRDQARKQRA